MSNQPELDKACDSCWKQGVANEQERILKLIEDSMANCFRNQPPMFCDVCYAHRDVIALIKGENK